MGRLFWKIFFGFWLTLVVVAAGVGLVVHWHSQARFEDMGVAVGPRADFMVAAVAAVLESGGASRARALLEQWPGGRRPPVLLVDQAGRDLFGRSVPEAALERARARLSQGDTASGLRRVTAPDGRVYTVFIPVPEGYVHRPHRSLLYEHFGVQLSIALLASLLFSAVLAWYLVRPVRHLRQASQALAAGQLDTRVAERIGRRGDEIAELGRDFDSMAARLQALVSSQRTLLHDVSHELRSPLARLQVAVGLARQHTEKMPAALDRIERECGRLDELVGQVLTLARLEAGLNPGAEARTWERLDLVDLLDAIVDDARFEAQARNRSVGWQHDESVIVQGAPEFLRRAFENVIRNALRFTEPGTEVSVSLHRDAGGAEAVVAVCDRGPGVSAAELETIFQPFYRGTGETGHGLGLAIAKGAIEAHGGRIRAGTRAGGGLCIEMMLPVLPPSAARPAGGAGSGIDTTVGR